MLMPCHIAEVHAPTAVIAGMLQPWMVCALSCTSFFHCTTTKHKAGLLLRLVLCNRQQLSACDSLALSQCCCCDEVLMVINETPIHLPPTPPLPLNAWQCSSPPSSAHPYLSPGPVNQAYHSFLHTHVLCSVAVCTDAKFKRGHGTSSPKRSLTQSCNANQLPWQIQTCLQHLSELCAGHTAGALTNHCNA